MCQGSPPRRRGKVRRGPGRQLRVRITPARAGKSTWAPSLRERRQDHPRVGGEKRGLEVRSQTRRGSPPRGRGKVPPCAGLPPLLRITPAWAGKRSPGGRCRIPKRDHPRVGGEKPEIARPRETYIGSPPRGRGKAKSRPHSRMPFWITPAWAGKRHSSGRTACTGRDHPRVGGEKRTGGALFPGVWGSPPRGRGKARSNTAAGLRLRITPAWAGKSPEGNHGCYRRWDHPRVGGEKSPAL